MKHTKQLLSSVLLCTLFCSQAWGQRCFDKDSVNQSPVYISKVVQLAAPPDLTIGVNRENLKTFYKADAHNVEVETRNHNPKISLRLNDSTYIFNNVHFHSPAEHILNGKRYDMEAHFVFKGVAPSRGAVVVGVLIDGQTGSGSNILLDSLVRGIAIAVNNMQRNPRYEYYFSNAVDLISMNLNQLVQGSYYTYTGSLTTEPFSEGITWIVLENEQKIAKEYYEVFKNLKYNSKRIGTSRNVQPLNNRLIFHSPAVGK